LSANVVLKVKREKEFIEKMFRYPSLVFKTSKIMKIIMLS